MSILGFMDQYPIIKIYQEKNSFLLLGKSDHLWAFIISENVKELESLMNSYEFETPYFAFLEEWMIPVITRFGQLEWSFETYRYYYPQGKVRPPSIDQPSLTPSLASFIYTNSHYQGFTTIEYIQERITYGLSCGLFIHDQLVAWGLTHDDGALGFLHVLPNFRQLGYGTQIIEDLIHKKDKENKDIFTNVVSSNDNGRRLFVKLGFEVDRKIFWLKLKER